MTKKILGIGNAIIDVLVRVDDNFLKKNNLIKGSMKLIDGVEFKNLKSNIKIENIVAGGSVANTMAGIAYLKGNASFIGKINLDEFGKIYKESLKNINVDFIYNEKKENLFITPDAERTMCTYLGVSSNLSKNDISENNIKDHSLLFLEGYLWDKGESEIMFKHAIDLAKKNKIEIAMTLSDVFCVKRHKQDFLNLLINDLDVLIGNENEINELAGQENLANSIQQLKEFNKLLIVTRGMQGSLAVQNNKITQCGCVKVEHLLDLTGAGDLFASGFLVEYIEKSDIKKCLENGSRLASKIIQQMGARLN
jgi:fructokinase